MTVCMDMILYVCHKALSQKCRVLDSPVRYVLKIHFFIESGLKMVQFKIQFKTKSRIFIQSEKYSIDLFLQKNEENYSKFQ